jgi:hypothetical protein
MNILHTKPDGDVEVRPPTAEELAEALAEELDRVDMYTREQIFRRFLNSLSPPVADDLARVAFCSYAY